MCFSTYLSFEVFVADNFYFKPHVTQKHMIPVEVPVVFSTLHMFILEMVRQKIFRWPLMVSKSFM